ncbi:hypothetical protein OPV22_030609 [Ensete ventricosum]|uniref:Uncharacterized protein n=1 Tax=Ensete ventricosum TaxID=4639 RepID=A0AAV8P8H8_ENSVE|nr:hypothetical protein OPV22_030609 [Ensete ventricosum]
MQAPSEGGSGRVAERPSNPVRAKLWRENLQLGRRRGCQRTAISPRHWKGGRRNHLKSRQANRINSPVSGERNNSIRNVTLSPNLALDSFGFGFQYLFRMGHTLTTDSFSMSPKST